MSIATVIESLADHVQDSYDVIAKKGGVVPEEKRLVNLPGAIESIPAEIHGTGGEFSLQTKTVTPEETFQTVLPDSGYFALSSVGVEAIPSQYQNTSDATATAEDILAGKTAYINGEKVIGTGEGKVEPKLQVKEVTPTKSAIVATPDEGYDGLSKVTVDQIPDVYQDTSDATASADDILSGKTAYINGEKVTGTATQKPDPTFQAKSVIPTAFEQTVTPDSGYDGLSKVTVMGIPEEPQNTEYRWWSPNMASNTTPSPYSLFGDGISSNSYIMFDNSTDTTVVLEPATYDEDDLPEVGFDFGIPVKIGGIKIHPKNGAGNIQSVTLLGNNTGIDNDFTEIATRDVYETLEGNTDATIVFDPVAYRYFKFQFTEHETRSPRSVTVGEITFYREFVINNVSLQSKTVNPTTTDQTVKPDGEYDGLSEVTVKAAPLQAKTATPSATVQTITPDAGNYGLSSVEVSAVATQTKSVTPTTSSQIITPDTGIIGLSQVTVAAIPSTYVNTTDGTASASDILSGKTAYVNGSKVTGTISSVTAATPSITVSSSGLITASTNQSGGVVTAATKSTTKQLTTQSAKTWTPTTSSQTIASGTYLTGTQTISAIPSTYKDTSDATATAADILEGKTAYVNGSKITGTAVLSIGSEGVEITIKIVNACSSKIGFYSTSTTIASYTADNGNHFYICGALQLAAGGSIEVQRIAGSIIAVMGTGSLYAIPSGGNLTVPTSMTGSGGNITSATQKTFIGTNIGFFFIPTSCTVTISNS